MQRQSIFDIMDIYVKKKPSSKLKFDCIGTCRNIWWKPYFTPERFFNQSDMAQDKIWRHKINAAAWKTENRKKSYKNSRFHALFYRYVNRCFCNLFPYQPLMTIFSVEFKPIFYYTNMPNLENCLHHKFSQICSTLCIYIHSLCNKMLINRYFFFLFWYVGKTSSV